jgi:hypothetical protein
MPGTDVPFEKALEAARGRLRRLNENMLLLERVPTAPGRFSKVATNVLVVRTDSPHLPYLALIDEDLRYCGRDPFLTGIFGPQPPANGWRPLVLAPGQLPGADLTGVAERVLAFLGFPGRTDTATTLPSGLSADWGFREALPPLVGREDLLEEAEAALAQAAERVAVVFVGAPGVGKTALVRELAWRWQEAHPGRLACRFDAWALADACLRWPATARPRQARLFEHVLRLPPPSLLVWEEMQLATMDPLARLALCRALGASLAVCGTVEKRSLPMVLSPRDLVRRLHLIAVPPPDTNQLTQVILPAVARYLESRYDVRVTPEALHLTQRVSESLSGSQPGKAVRVLDRALARARRRQVRVLGPDDVLETKSAISN